MKVAVIGTGLMGAPIAETVIKNGHEVFVYNRTQKKAAALGGSATIAKTPNKAIENAEIVLLLLSDFAAIESCLFLPSSPLTLKDKTIIQMGTISPEESTLLSQKVSSLKGRYSECPVLGSIQEVKSSELILLFGGSKKLFEELTGFLSIFGNELVYVGDIGKAASLKLALNQLIVSHIVGFSNSLALIQKSGVDLDIFMSILRKSALYAPMFDKKLDKLLSENFQNPNFPVKHMLKDIHLFLEAAEDLHIKTTGIEGARKIFQKAVDAGFESEDYSAVFKIIKTKEKPE